MFLFNKLFGKISPKQRTPNIPRKELEHAVIVYFNYKQATLAPLHELERRLERVIKDKRAGEYDGHEIREDYQDGTLYMYGPDATILFEVVKQTLETTDFMPGARAKLRFGPPELGVAEIEVAIGLNI